MKKTFKITLVRDGSICFIPVPFDPRPVFGKVRAPAISSPKQSPKKPTPKKSAKTPRLNAAWHGSHRMPKNPTTEQRLAWHVAHQKHCGCRPMPATLRALMR
jgi:hypothetical protein